MNVNLWGPELWSVLHGIAALTTRKNIEHTLTLLDELCVLLPCVHCRKSYVEFYSRSEADHALRSKKAIEYLYKIHSMVDDKLEAQRLATLFETVLLSKEQQDHIKQSSIILSTRPSLMVVKKRWELSEGKPFSDSSVWKVLFAFIMLLDTDSKGRRESYAKFCSSLSHILMDSLEYNDLGHKLWILSSYLPTFTFNAHQGFIATALARENMLKYPLNTAEFMKTIEHAEVSWIKPLWNLYRSNLPASSCQKNTCK